MSGHKARSALLLVLILAAALAIQLGGIGEAISLSGLKARLASLQAFVASRPAEAVAAFIAVQVVALALCVPGAVLGLALLAGALFGPVKGSLIVLAGLTIGDSLGFLLARYVVRDFLSERFKHRLSAIPPGANAATLLGLRLMAVMPYFVVNIAMAMTDMRLRLFAPVSFVGLIPSTILYVSSGTLLARIEKPSDIWTPPLLAAFVALGVVPILIRWGYRRFEGKTA